MFFAKSVVSCKQNTDFWKMFGWLGMWSMGDLNWFLETPGLDKGPLVYVKCPLSKHGDLRHLSHLREMHTSKMHGRLVYAKRYFFLWLAVSSTQNTYFGKTFANWASNASIGYFVFEIELPSQMGVSSTRNGRFWNTVLLSARFVQTKCTLSKSTVVSSTRDATFFENVLSRLRETLTFRGLASQTCPRWVYPNRSKSHIRKKKCAVSAAER